MFQFSGFDCKSNHEPPSAAMPAPRERDLYSLGLQTTQSRSYVGHMMCIYIYTYIHTYLYSRLYVYFCLYAGMHACMHACMFVCMYVCMYVCMHVCIHICIYVYVHGGLGEDATCTGCKDIMPHAAGSPGAPRLCLWLFKRRLSCGQSVRGPKRAWILYRDFCGSHNMIHPQYGQAINKALSLASMRYDQNFW